MLLIHTEVHIISNAQNRFKALIVFPVAVGISICFYYYIIPDKHNRQQLIVVRPSNSFQYNMYFHRFCSTLLACLNLSILSTNSFNQKPVGEIHGGP